LEIQKLNKKIQEKKGGETKKNNIEGWTFIRNEAVELN
jgi:hypothetical protein